MESAPIREVRPVVVPAQFFTWVPLVSAFAAVFPGMFAFVISNVLTGFFGNPSDMLNNGPVVIYGVLAYLIGFGICMWLGYVKVYLEPARTRYMIYSDRIEYDEGLWNRHRRTVIFDQVIDVELTEGVLQQSCGAGTIALVTQQLVSGQDGKLGNRRVAMVNVPQPREVYDLVRSMALKKKG